LFLFLTLNTQIICKSIEKLQKREIIAIVAATFQSSRKVQNILFFHERNCAATALHKEHIRNC